MSVLEGWEDKEYIRDCGDSAQEEGSVEEGGGIQEEGLIVQ